MTHGACEVTWSDTMSTDTVIISNGSEIYARLLTYQPKEYYYHEYLGVEMPNQSINWCMVDEIRALYNTLVGSSDHTCETPTDYTMFMFDIDAKFDNTTYPITLSHIEPTVIREGQGLTTYPIKVYGYGFTESDESNLECHIYISDTLVMTTSVTVESINNIE